MSLTAFKQGANVVLDFAPAPWFLRQLYRDSIKTALGMTPFGADTQAARVTDPGAASRSGSDYYQVKGLSVCSLTAGP